MPPLQPFQALKSRGYVCRSCLLKLQAPRKQQTPWLSRSVSNQRRPLKGSSATTNRERKATSQDGSTFRVFDRTEGGDLVEVPDDPEEEFNMESLNKAIRDLEEMGVASTPGSRDMLDEETLGDGEEFLQKPADFLKGMQQTIDPRVLAAMDSANKLFEVHVRKLGDITSSTNRSVTEAEPAAYRPAKIKALDPASDTSSAVTTTQSTLPEGISRIPKNIPASRFPKAYEGKILRLNQSLNEALFGYRRRVPRKPKPKLNTSRNVVWKDYLLCRIGLLQAPADVPLEVWSGLWKVFESNEAENLDRMAHLKTLGDDMRKAGVNLHITQRILHIESTFIHGDQDQAIRDWRVAEAFLIDDAAVAKDYWDLGVRMFCVQGQIDQAVRAVKRTLEIDGDPAAYRILIPLIKAFLTLEGSIGPQHAWALYLRLRINLGDAITMEDYDAVISLFLDASQPDLALGIFKDMMLTGDTTVAVHDSIHLFDDTGDEYGFMSIDVEKGLDWTQSTALSRLPAKYNNMIFFGSWIKKLIGDGRLDSAKQVLDLMIGRGICPSPIHMNGFIGALFREGTEKSRIEAEDLAWKMIRARTDFVRERDISKRRAVPYAVATVDKPGTKSVMLTPRATIETFTILLRQYRRRQKPELVSDLFEALRNSRIPPNTYFMNEILWMELRAQNKDQLWATYSGFGVGKGTSPDIETYTILWQNMKKQVDSSTGKVPATLPQYFSTSRDLFADMARQAPHLLRKETVPRELYELIILCFSYEQDQPGAAVALRALQHHFNIYPNEETVRSIILQLSRLGMVDEWGQEVRRLNLSGAQGRERVASVTKLLQMYKRQRAELLTQQGIAFEELSQEAKLEEALILLVDLLRFAHEARFPNKSSQKASQQAAVAMRVPDCVPWEEVSSEEQEDVQS